MKLSATCIDLLHKIKSLKIDLWVESGKLKFQAPSNVIDTFLKEAISTHKNEIMQWLDGAGENLQSAILPHQDNLSVWPIAKEQEVLWQASKLADSGHVYNIPYAFILNGKVNIEKLKEAIRKLYVSERILRIGFKQIEGKIYQYDLGAESIALTDGKLSDNHQSILTHCEMLAASDFNLEADPCVFFDIRTLNPEKYLLTIVLHHIIADAASIDLILERLSNLYSGVNQENDKVDFLDYSISQSGVDLDKKTLESILQRYQTLPDSNIFPYDKGFIKTDSNSGENFQFLLSNALSSSLSAYAKRKNVSLYTVLLSGYYAMLRKYSRVDQHCVGISISTRNTMQKKHIIGPMLSTAALMVDVSLKETFETLVNQVNLELVNALDESQKVSFLDFLSGLKNSHREVGPLFNTIFLLQPKAQNIPLLINCEAQPVDVLTHFAKFDLTFSVREINDALSVNIEYKTDLFTEKRINEIAKHYESTLERLVADSNKKLGDFSLEISGIECHDRFSNGGELLLERIYNRVKKTPENIALYDKKIKVTYAALWAAASHLAKKVIMSTNEPYVGILLERSINSVIAMLAILLAKKAFVPIDNENPPERINHIIEDAGLTCVITDSTVKHLLPTTVFKLAVEDICFGASETLLPEILEKDNAYMIYTSGSTGKPKGVRINHGHMAHYIAWATSEYLDKYSINHSLVHSSIAFDLTITSIFAPLANGGEVFIPEGFGVEVLSQYISENKNLGLIKLTPSHLNLVSNALSHIVVDKTGVIVVGGEAFYAKDALILLNTSPSLVFINEYGPTETTVGCTQFILSNENRKKFSSNDPVPIGKAIDRMHIEIMDEFNQACPNYIPGEIYISGSGVSDGYWNREDLNHEKFVTKTDDSGKTYKVYRTGDLAFKSDPGDFIYIGRIDEQIKLNGYRIEIGEINNTLAFYPDVHSVQTIAHEGELVCYIVPKKQVDLDAVKLKSYAQAQLPFYMCPTHYIFLEEMPLTVNGKLDVSVLPKPRVVEIEKHAILENSLEGKLYQIWSEILENKDIGVKDDFFRIGGDSILSIQITSELRNQGFDCNIRTIFETRTIEGLANYIRSKESRSEAKSDAETGELTGSLELLPIQKWFFEKKFTHPNHFNHAFLVRVPSLDRGRLNKIISELAKHHDVLRMQYIKTSESMNYIQQYTKEISTPELFYLDRSGMNDAELNEALTEWQSNFHIEGGPLWQVGYITGYPDNGARLFFALHHLIIDSVSWRILIEDIQCLYEGKTLSAKTSSYRQWVKAVQHYCEKSSHEVSYWQNITQDPFIYPAVTGKYHEKVVKLDSSLTKDLLEKSNQAYHTEINDLLLTALAFALKDWTGRNVNHITLEGHGREYIDPGLDVSRTVGWFTTQYPVRLEVFSDIENSIKSIKEVLRNIPTKGLGFSAFKYVSEQLKEINFPPISFNYLGQFKRSDALWQVTGEPAGRALHPDNWGKNLLDINGYIVDNQLQFFIGGMLDARVIEQFSIEFHSVLEKLIYHCADRENSQQSVFTPSDFPMVRLSQSLLDKIQDSYKVQAIYPANSLQQGFIYHALSQPNDDAYRVQLLYDYFCKLDVEYYLDAWRQVINIYPVLRTCFNWEEEPVQVVCKEGEIVWTVHDISEAKDQEASIREIQIADRKCAFDLNKPKLLRIHVIKRADAHYTILKSEHHAISDGWSNSVLFNQVHENYLSLISNKNTLHSEEKAYLAAQDYYCANQQHAKMYWENRLSEVLGKNNLNTIFTTQLDINTFDKVKDSRQNLLILPMQNCNDLKYAANRAGVTLNVLCQFAWHQLLHAYTQGNHTIVGTTVSGRALPIPDIGRSVGLYINTLPLIVDWSKENITIQEQLQNIHHDMMQMDTYGFAQLGELRQKGLARFDSIFVFENYPGGQSNNALNFKFKDAIEKLDVPLALIVYEENSTLCFKLKYAGEFISDEQVHRVMMQLEQRLKSLPSQLHEKYSSSSFMKEDEYQKIVYDWNSNANEFNSDTKTLVDLFENQVKKFPKRIAVSCKEKDLTFESLDKKSSVLSRWIIKNNKENSFISVCCERSLEMIIAIVAVLKAGCAYVPIDPEYPIERIRFILEDTRANIVLTQSLLLKQLNEISSSSCFLSLDDFFKKKELVEKTLTKKINSNDLAYVIYTSGTTGKPKGVMLEHRSVINYIKNLSRSLSSEYKNVDFSSSLAFDLSVTTTLGTLLLGNTIQIYPGKIDNLDAYVDHLITREVHLIKMVPAVYELLSKRLPSNTVLKEVILGGEKLNRANLTYHPNVTVFDEYGPTEATVGTTLANVFPGKQPGIGKAYKNYKLYVLDKNNSPVPIGVVGELFIGGAGLARGYLNRPELTSERFIHNPFSTDEDIHHGYDRLYKTGDLVKWLPDGNLVYYGRNDFQIKLNGFRIELEEIENILNSYEGIEQSVVVLQKNSEYPYLAAYYVAKKIINDSLIHDYLAERLPHYMVPTFYANLTALPLTTNGKLDVNALPKFEFLSGSQYVAPRNAKEVAVCDIWRNVLSMQKVGIYDDFFAIGGYSIAAMRIVHGMSQYLGYTVTISDLLQHRTVANVLSHCSDQKINLEIPLLESEEDIELSFAQKRLWFIERYEGGSAAYNVPFYLKLDLETNIEAFKLAIQSVINRHDVLRTVFVQDKSGIDYQRVLPDPLKIIEKKITNSELSSSFKAMANSIFDLRKNYPIHVTIYDTEEGYYAALIFHHIAFDGWSTGIFFKELSAFYQQFAHHVISDLPPLKIQYKDFAVWQKHYLQGEKLDQEIFFWKNMLNNSVTLDLPTDHPRPNQIDYTGEYVYQTLPKTLSAQLKLLAQKEGTTLYTLMLSAFYLLLHGYTRQNDLIVGTVVANREYSALESLIGFFVNSLPLRAKINSNISFIQFVQETHELVLKAQMHQALPFEKMVEILKIEKDTSRHPLFQVVFGMQNFNESLGNPNASFELLPTDSTYKIAKFDLSLFIDETQTDLKAVFNYAERLFEKETIERFSRHYIYILEQIISHSEQPIHAISLLTPQEERIILQNFNNSSQLKSSKQTICERFESVAAEYPEFIALTHQGASLNYSDLNKRANQLARYIVNTYERTTGNLFKPDTLVGICLEKGFDLLIGTLAILKAGGAYVPMDFDSPEDRMRFIFEDTQSRLLITQKSFENKMRAILGDTVTMLFVDDNRYQHLSDDNFPASSEKNNLAYVIYTSGTTGKPKGVMIEHHSVVDLAVNTSQLPVSKNDTLIFLSAPVFDAATFEIWGSLLNGAKLVIPAEEKELLADTNRFKFLLLEEKISQLWLTKTLFDSLYLRDSAVFNGLDTLLVGGEALDLHLMNRLLSQSHRPKRIVNGYGPTESTTFAVIFDFQSDIKINSVPIGKIIDQRLGYVLDENLNPVPIGVVGELYIGGSGLARGYLNRPDLEDERFITHHFPHTLDAVRLYRTGDLVKYLPDGNLIYLGRNDSQVKIRGYRIELREIETRLAEYPGITQAVVLVKERKKSAEDNDSEGMTTKYILAYYVSDIKINPDDLSRHLSFYLPNYMLPNSFIKLEELPRTANGKLDIKSLPELDALSDRRLSYVAPKNKIEREMVSIWQSVLHPSDIGISDDFFRIGGDSILSLQLVSKLRDHGYHCSIKAIFEDRTIEQLVKRLSATAFTAASIEAEQGVLEGAFELLPIQKWFFEQPILHRAHWNQSFLVKVPPLDIQRLKNVLRELSGQHDMLRLHFIKQNGHYLQKYIGSAASLPELLTLNKGELSDDVFLAQLTQWQSDFDIENGPLWKVGYIFGYEDGSARLYFALHHLIVDTVSWRILIEDFKRLYEGKPLDKKTSSYRQWVSAVTQYPEVSPEEWSYWSENRAPLGKSDIFNEIGICDQKYFGIAKLDKVLTKQLLQDANHAYSTEISDLLLTALAYALKDLSGENECCVALEGHGRESISESLDLSRTVGWFTTLYPVKLMIQNNFSQSIKAVKSQLKRLPHKGLGYGAFRYHHSERYLQETQLPKVSFNYLGQFDSQDGFWQVAAENSGLSMIEKNTGRHGLNINGWVINGELQFEVDAYIPEQKARQFVSAFQDYLSEIVLHCIEKKNKNEIEYSEDDFVWREQDLLLPENLVTDAHFSEVFQS